MVKTVSKDTYLIGTTPTELQNEVTTRQKIKDDKENQVMINQSVNEFYTFFLFKIDAFQKEVVFPFDIATTFFNNLRPDILELLISEGVQFPQILPTKNNHQGNQRLILNINAAVEA